MIKYKGRSKFKQYVPAKPIKYGFKSFYICDSLNGYTFDFQIYKGKENGTVQHGLGAQVVLDLCAPLLGKNYHVDCDNFFSSPYIANALAEKNTFFIGTCRTNRKGVPDAVKGVFRKKETPRGESVGAWAVDERGQVIIPKIRCMMWMDKQPVGLINTIAPPNVFTTVERRQPDGTRKNITCPVAVKLYNSFMGGVDLADNLRKLCESSRKSKRWYMRIFWYTVEVAIINSFVIMKEVNVSGRTDQPALQPQGAREKKIFQ
ncbi:piggyBac transposable element-derived protein 4-like [Oscarella lobularis]|uniref:piggyBac transposable element-derived protein 4-like n=1 Tax=Oscarella lobularis TaxID=121494 RepID=UPI003313E94C